eukprot:scaffold74818_cov73-Phaeocystis_antarctica.AAC.1
MCESFGTDHRQLRWPVQKTMQSSSRKRILPCSSECGEGTHVRVTPSHASALSKCVCWKRSACLSSEAAQVPLAFFSRRAVMGPSQLMSHPSCNARSDQCMSPRVARAIKPATAIVISVPSESNCDSIFERSQKAVCPRCAQRTDLSGSNCCRMSSAALPLPTITTRPVLACTRSNSSGVSCDECKRSGPRGESTFDGSSIGATGVPQNPTAKPVLTNRKRAW